ncbi:MAG TPA: hypothetical protein VFM45_12740 [Anaeromyxobacteraceae bacterium]|nr:hypothetical protein [Anaeromyxobacteraceae bacterium]
MASTRRGLLSMVLLATTLAACEAHVLAVPPPHLDGVPRPLSGSVPVSISVEVQDPPVVGEMVGGTGWDMGYDYTVPDLRDGVRDHVAAAVVAFGLEPRPQARLSLRVQAEPYVRVRESQGGLTLASVVGTMTLSDERGTLFEAPLLGRVRRDGKLDPGAAFQALDDALVAWFRALDAKIRSQPEVAQRLRER